VTALKAYPCVAACRLIAAADAIVGAILDGRIVSRRMLNTAMGDAFGAQSADGTWTQRDSFQMLEISTLKALRQLAVPTDPVGAMLLLADLETRLPTQTVRSEEQIAHQHFSTPLALSWLMARMALIGANDVVLEPSAGTGLLAAWVAEGSALHLNEIDETRADILRQMFELASVTSEDGARVSQLAIHPSVILMNPPFARNAAGGEDRLAAARHIAAAVAALRPGGRLVAIMPDSFSPQGRGAEVFVRALQGCRVAAHFRIEGAFRSHGTNVAVRLLAIDKVPGKLTTTIVQRASLLELLPFIEQVPARLPSGTAGTVTAQSDFSRQTSRGPLFKALPRRPKPAPVRHAPLDVEAVQAWAEVAYSLIEAPADASEGSGVYAAWRPQRIVFASAADHPAALVESAAMASVIAPAPTYLPRLPRAVLDKQVLSAAQLETVVHALDAHEHDLPGRYIMPDKGLDLVPSAEGHIYRQGFFLGDGTGAGKGRQLAGILIDQWLRGNRRHIWVSENSALQCDALRDWEALGGMGIDIHSLSKFKPEAMIGLSAGILFASYATLRSASGGKTRLQQILEWCGPDFDGCILFDEAHAMGGVAGGEGRFGSTKGSQQGIAGVEIQNRLPRARVVYASATGATDGRVGAARRRTAPPSEPDVPLSRHPAQASAKPGVTRAGSSRAKVEVGREDRSVRLPGERRRLAK